MNIKTLIFLLLSISVQATVRAQSGIVDLAVNSKTHSTLVKALRTSGLIQTLKGKGPFTLFAPTNSAFEKLPAETSEQLMKTENKGRLSALLTYHVVSGQFTSDALLKAIKKGGGAFTLKTLRGGTLTFSINNGNITITDTSGNIATVTAANNIGTNGVLHAIDTLLQP